MQVFIISFTVSLFLFVYFKYFTMSINNLKDEIKKGRNSYMVWTLCYLWFISLYSIVWSMFLFLTIRETLWVTGTDLINLFVLLSGIFMVPANIRMLSQIANGHGINYSTKVFCCPLWLYMMFIVVVNLCGAALCARKIHRCRYYMHHLLVRSMQLYKSTPSYKNFIDNLQWTFKCCGIESYQDWFNLNWFDEVNDYDYDENKTRSKKRDITVRDSVPLSCCKTGNCYPHYLMELGTNSINRDGCIRAVYRILIVIMTLHFIVFLSIAVLEMSILYCTLNLRRGEQKTMQFLSVNEKFRDSSNSRYRPTDCTTTEPTDGSDFSETDISVLEHSISEIQKSIDCVTKLCNKGRSGTQIVKNNPPRRYCGPTTGCDIDNQLASQAVEISNKAKPQRRAISSPESKTLDRVLSRSSKPSSPPPRNPPKCKPREDQLLRTGPGCNQTPSHTKSTICPDPRARDELWTRTSTPTLNRSRTYDTLPPPCLSPSSHCLYPPQDCCHSDEEHVHHNNNDTAQPQGSPKSMGPWRLCKDPCQDNICIPIRSQCASPSWSVHSNLNEPQKCLEKRQPSRYSLKPIRYKAASKKYKDMQ